MHYCASILSELRPGRVSVGRVSVGVIEVTVHSLVADGQVIHPFLLQISIDPSLLMLQPQRELAALSIHIPTAVLPSVANAGDDNPIVAKPKETTSKDSNFMIKISPKLLSFEIEATSPDSYNSYSWRLSFMQSQ